MTKKTGAEIRESFDSQQRVLRELKDALTAEPVVRVRWERIRLTHGDWRCRTPGAPKPDRLSETNVRVEVGMLASAGDLNEFLAVRLGHEPVPITLTFDYAEADLDEIPQRVTSAVRAYLEETA